MVADVLPKAVAAAAFMFMGLVLNGCMTHDIKMTYKCTTLINTHQGLTCGEWLQSGGVQTPSCFPAQATVLTKSGTKAMADLTKGEEILGFDHASGRPVFTAVRAWLHRVPSAQVNMASVVSDAGTLVVSTRHSLAVQGGEAYKFAGDLKPGQDTLVTQDGASISIQKVSDTLADGLYAPLTGTSNFFVGGPGERPAVLAHSFAQLQQPRRYEAAFHHFLSIAEFFRPSISDIDDTFNEPYVHPVARMWMRIAGVSTYQEIDELPTRRTIRPNSEGGFNDIETTRDDGLTQRRLAAERRLAGGGGNGNNNNNQMMVIFYAVVSNFPPFLRHGVVPAASDLKAGLQPPLVTDATTDVNTWLEDNKKKGLYYSIAMGILVPCLWCCFVALSGSGQSRAATMDVE